MHAPIDLTNRRFGKLVALARVAGGRWLCQCDCGRVSMPVTNSLLAGLSKSCGCRRREVRVEFNKSRATHGLSKSRTYKSWMAMRARCLNPRHRNFPAYGARGISVCARWAESFEAFLEDMGIRPPGTTIDRIDNSGNYEPGNCRWATNAQQNRNKRGLHWVSFRGETLTMSEWAARIGMSMEALSIRFKKGWTTERALTTPPRRWS